MFEFCNSLTEVPLFNTSNVTNMAWMLIACTSIKTIPLFDTSKVTDMSYMCSGCVRVVSGAFELYQQASTQANIPTHTATFKNCGASGQIPIDWKED
jgi:surface protein